ncbi:uncharacterized protein VTP21DRAFT_9360 [Calcarisporiella thermophila]|uniref:uncharacterized protein n=1 Tax=Calcarisporiella thermophila TaxID=911321 RepID=UPI003742BD38
MKPILVVAASALLCFAAFTQGAPSVAQNRSHRRDLGLPVVEDLLMTKKPAATIPKVSKHKPVEKKSVKAATKKISNPAPIVEDKLSVKKSAVKTVTQPVAKSAVNVAEKPIAETKPVKGKPHLSRREEADEKDEPTTGQLDVSEVEIDPDTLQAFRRLSDSLARAGVNIKRRNQNLGPHVHIDHERLSRLLLADALQFFIHHH